MNHKICHPLSTPEDTVYIAASLFHWPDEFAGYWWLTYRLCGDKIEVSRMLPSLSSGRLGQTIENVPRFVMHFEEGNVLRAISFDDSTIEVTIPRRIYDYTEPLV